MEVAQWSSLGSYAGNQSLVSQVNKIGCDTLRPIVFSKGPALTWESGDGSCTASAASWTMGNK